jgi:hypothetical protein
MISCNRYRVVLMRPLSHFMNSGIDINYLGIVEATNIVGCSADLIIQLLYPRMPILHIFLKKISYQHIGLMICH